MKFSRTKQTIRISINWNNKASIDNGEKLSKSLINKGYYLYSQSLGWNLDTFIYKKS